MTQIHKHTAEKYTAVVKNQHCAEKWADAENAAWIFRDTTENRVGTTQQHYTPAHSKHSKRFYAFFIRFANSSAAEQHYKQRVRRFTASCVCCVAVAF
jgi:hypothetical protein